MHMPDPRPPGLPPSADEPLAPAPPGLGSRIALRLAAPAVIGAATGGCVAAANWLTTDHALALLAALPGSWPAVFSPFALLVTLGVATWVTRASRPSTSELYIVTYHSSEARLPLREVPGRVLGAMTTVSFGGSQGLESASALIGAAFGQLTRRLFRNGFPEDERRALMVCGASAGIADAVFVAGALLVAVACGLGARLFAWAGERLKYRAGHESPLGRATGAGVLLALLAWAGHAISGSWITFGPGYFAADWLLAGPHPLWLLGATLLIRTAGTLTCVYGGGGGGVFTSLACTGTFIGQIVAQALGRTESHVFPFLGAACFLGSGYRILMGPDSVSEAKRRDRMD